MMLKQLARGSIFQHHRVIGVIQEKASRLPLETKGLTLMPIDKDLKDIQCFVNTIPGMLKL